MEVGAIGYHDEKMRKLVKDVAKDNTILGALKKTRREEYPNLQELKEKKIQ